MAWKWTVDSTTSTIGALTLKEGTASILQITGVSASFAGSIFDGSNTDDQIATEIAKAIDVSDTTITIKDDDVFYKDDTSGKVTAIQLVDVADDSKYTGDYKLAVASSVTTDAEQEQTLGSTWTVEGTTATNTATIDGVYALNEDKTKLYRSVDYTVTVSGLKSGVQSNHLTESDGVITIAAAALADGITVTTALKDTEAKNVPTTVDYELEVATGEGKASVDYAWYQKPKAADVTLYQTVTGGEDTYYSEGTVIKQIKDKSATEGKETELCTVTGLGLDKNTSKTDREDADVTGIEVKMKGGTTGILVVNSDLLDPTADDHLKKVQIKSGNFTFEFDKEDYKSVAVHEREGEEIEWKVSKGKAVLTGGMTEGYALSSDGKTLTYTKAKDNAIATISGFDKNLSDDKAAELATALKAATGEDGVVTLTKAILDTYTDSNKAVKVALKNGKDSNKQPYEYKLELAANSGFTATGTWTLGYKEKNGAKIPTGKAIYTGKVTAGYVISGGTITKADDKDEGTELVELSGLNVAKLNELIEDGTLTVGGNDNEILSGALALEDGKFTLSKATISTTTGEGAEEVTTTEKVNIFDTKKVTIKNKVKGVEFGLAVGNENANTDLGQIDDTTAWTIDAKGGKATYYTGKSAGYVVDEKKGTTATFTQPGTDDIKATLATLSGIPKTATADDFEVEPIKTEADPPVTTGYAIKLQESLFSGLKKSTIITLENGEDQNCTLDVDVDADNKKTSDHDVVATPYATVEKGKAIVAKGMPEYWDLTADRKVTYYPAGKAKETYATVSGLKKDVTEDDVQVNLETGVITVNASAIDTSKLAKTKITLKLGKDVAAGTYKLVLGDGFGSNEGQIATAGGENAWDTTTKTGQAIYKLDVTGDGIVAEDTSITYKGTGGTYKATALATLKNITGTIADPDENSGVVKLASANLLDGKKATLGKKDPYVLALHAGDSAAKATGKWTVSGTKATLEKGTLTAGHYQKDNFTIDVVKATKTGKTESKALATIDGLVANSTLDNISTATSTIALTADKLGDTVTVDGKGMLAFSFGSGTKTTPTEEGGNPTTEDVHFTSKTVKGSALSDSFTFDANSNKLTVETGKGNDYVDFGTDTRGTGKANTFVYSTGDGYDEVADFTATDYLEIKGAKKIEVNQVSGGNTYISVDKGTATAGVITLDSFSYSALDISGLGADDTAKLIAPDYDFDSANASVADHVALTKITLGKGSTNYESGYSDSFDKSFTLSSDNAFTAKISFTKKTT